MCPSTPRHLGRYNTGITNSSAKARRFSTPLPCLHPLMSTHHVRICLQLLVIPWQLPSSPAGRHHSPFPSWQGHQARNPLPQLCPSPPVQAVHAGGRSQVQGCPPGPAACGLASQGASSSADQWAVRRVGSWHEDPSENGFGDNKG